MDLQGLDDKADGVDQEDEDSTLSNELLERVVEERRNEEHSIIWLLSWIAKLPTTYRKNFDIWTGQHFAKQDKYGK